MRTRSLAHLFALMAGAAALAIGATRMESSGDPDFTSDFDLEHCHIFGPLGANKYWSLNPGRFLRYEGEDEGEFVELEIRVLRRLRRIEFDVNGTHLTAIARVIEEREWIDGELVEVSRNYFARCPRSSDIFYFGEEVDIYENGEIVGHDGAWLAGVDGAEPGLIMPNLPLMGARYYQEIAPDVALDRAEHVAMGETVVTPAGTFHDCLVVLETTPLEPGAESIKVYAPGIGLIVDDFLELVEFHD